MVPLTQQILVCQNADFQFLFALLDVNSNPMDLTGARVVSQIRSAKKLTAPIKATMDSQNNDNSVQIDLETAQVLLYLPQSLTETLYWGNPGFWDCLIVWSNGQTDRIFEGEAILSPGVTSLQ